MTIRDGIVSAMKGDAGIAAVVGAKVFPSVAGTGRELPYVTVQRISAYRHKHFRDTLDGANSVRLQVDGWGRTVAQVGAIEEAVLAWVKAVLANILAGETRIAGKVVQAVSIDDSGDEFDLPESAGEQGTERIRLDLIVHFMP